MRKILVFAALALGIVPALALGAPTKTTVLTAKMTAAQEKPKGEGGAKGMATIKLDAAKGSVCWSFTSLVKVKAPTVSHIHKGRKGVEGPVYIPLGGKYKAKGCTKASKAQINAVIKNPSGFYVNIHNKEYPAGTVRGQL
jgi:CHRD domain